MSSAFSDKSNNNNDDNKNSLWPTTSTTRSGFGGGFLSMGLDTFQVSMSDLFAANRKKLISKLKQQHDGGIVYLQGGCSTTRYDSDHEPIFRQESYFLYLFGVKEPDCAACIEVDSGKTTLFIPKLPQEYAIIMGRIKSCQEFQDIYQVDDVQYMDDVEEILLRKVEEKSKQVVPVHHNHTNGGATMNGSTSISNGISTTAGPIKILLMRGLNSDSGNYYEPPSLKTLHKYIDTDILFPILAECRVHKSNAELSILRYVTEVTSYGHAYVMKNMRPGMMEYQGESLFRHYCYYNYGCRFVGYTPICACGPNASVLHYGHTGEPNARQIQDGEICLFDMGAEYKGGYGSDVTCSFPINGKYTKQQAGIHTAVLNAQRAVYDILKPGVSWVECHKAAEGAILKQLLQIGIVTIPSNDTTTIEDLVEMRLGAVFMPHGLGHFIGIDTHDVGGYIESRDHPSRILMPGLKSLRTARIIEENMTLTVEPGCYFIDHLLDEGIRGEKFSKYLNAGLIDSEYRNFGGIRLEDVVAITKDGFVNYTLCPRTIEEVENIMSDDGTKNKWPPIKDMAPELCREHLVGGKPTPSKPSPPSLS